MECQIIFTIWRGLLFQRGSLRQFLLFPQVKDTFLSESRARVQGRGWKKSRLWSNVEDGQVIVWNSAELSKQSDIYLL